MNYAGYLKDGSLFDSNLEEIAKKYNTFDHRRADAGGYQPIPTDYSKNAQLIPGFREGLLMMSVGDKIYTFNSIASSIWRTRNSKFNSSRK